MADLQEPPSNELPPPPIPFHVSRHRRFAAIATGVMLLLYVLFFRWIFTTPLLKGSGGVVSLSFVFGVPFAMGSLTVAIGRWSGSDDWWQQSRFACCVLLAGLTLCVVFASEAIICIIMATPILFFGVLAGTAFAHSFLPTNQTDTRLRLAFILLIPFFAAWTEGFFDLSKEIKSIETTLVIQAPAEVIWTQIASVPAIDPKQLSNRWIYWLDFPRPIAATLDHEGVGGIRTATFERNVSFFETVTVWDRPRKLSFSIHADPNFIPHTAFDQHIIVGGRFYDVLDGTYEIEPLTPASCRLHLTSRHRLSTRFNAYAGWWSEKVMDEIQGSIMEVIRQRAEAASTAARDGKS